MFEPKEALSCLASRLEHRESAWVYMLLLKGSKTIVKKELTNPSAQTWLVDYFPTA